MNAGADRRQQVARLRAEPAPYLADAFFDDTVSSSAPSRVKCSDGAFFAVYENHGQAIGCLHCKQKARSVRNQAITGNWRFGRVIHPMN
jgi:hypothetical protein